MSGRKVMVQPINVIFRHLQTKSRVQIWLHDQKDMRLEGVIIGFDEFMNVTLDDASEVYVKTGKDSRYLGRTLLKGDNITIIQLATIEGDGPRR